MDIQKTQGSQNNLEETIALPGFNTRCTELAVHSSLGSSACTLQFTLDVYH